MQSLPVKLLSGFRLRFSPSLSPTTPPPLQMKKESYSPMQRRNAIRERIAAYPEPSSQWNGIIFFRYRIRNARLCRILTTVLPLSLETVANSGTGGVHAFTFCCPRYCLQELQYFNIFLLKTQEYHDWERLYRGREGI